MLRLSSIVPALDTAKGGPLAKRLHAWWEGYYLDPDAPPPEPEEEIEPESNGDTPQTSDDKRQAAIWSDPRAQIGEMLWGSGFTTPGGPAHVKNLINPLGLDSRMTVLDVGCGLGGTTRAIHAETGAWVTGYEASELYVEAAQELSQMAGLNRKAAVQGFDAEDVSFRDNACNAVFSKEAIFAVKNKEGIFKGIYEALKVDGQLLFTDYLLTKPDAEGEAVGKWLEAESPAAHPWCLEQVRTCLTDLGFEIRVTEDVTDEHRHLILAAWGQFTAALADKQYDRGWGPGLLAEAELWTNRIKALESGDLGVFRIYGRKYEPGLKR